MQEHFAVIKNSLATVVITYFEARASAGTLTGELQLQVYDNPKKIISLVKSTFNSNSERENQLLYILKVLHDFNTHYDTQNVQEICRLMTTFSNNMRTIIGNDESPAEEITVPVEAELLVLSPLVRSSYAIVGAELPLFGELINKHILQNHEWRLAYAHFDALIPYFRQAGVSYTDLYDSTISSSSTDEIDAHQQQIVTLEAEKRVLEEKVLLLQNQLIQLQSEPSQLPAEKYIAYTALNGGKLLNLQEPIKAIAKKTNELLNELPTITHSPAQPSFAASLSGKPQLQKSLNELLDKMLKQFNNQHHSMSKKNLTRAYGISTETLNDKFGIQTAKRQNLIDAVLNACTPEELSSIITKKGLSNRLAAYQTSNTPKTHNDRQLSNYLKVVKSPAYQTTRERCQEKIENGADTAPSTKLEQP